MEALILYGSAARGDNVVGSDCDLLAITESSDHSMVVRNNVNLAIYSFEQAMEMSRNGEIFMLHILAEGKVLYDKSKIFASLEMEYAYKPSYSSEISRASDLGWALLAVAGDAKNFSLLNKRIAWCVRTILISKTAEARSPVFSARGLGERFGAVTIERLIENKASEMLEHGIIRLFSEFLLKHGLKKPDWLTHDDPVVIAECMEESGNLVGQQTMLRIFLNSSDPGY